MVSLSNHEDRRRMKITGITITKHRLKMDPPFRASWDSRPRVKFDAYIVRVATDQGITGIAGTDTMLAGFPGHEDLFVGWDPLALERHNRILSNIQFHYGRCWPIDIALWDIAGKAAGLPVWTLLGGASGTIPADLSSGTLRDAGEMAELGERTVAQGYKAMKIRFHRPDWRDDVKSVAAVRKRVGDKLVLMVDCNQGWRMPWDADEPWTLKDALEVARPLEDLDVYWMEEPLHRGDYAGMRALRQATSVRIAGGELTRELHELREIVTTGCMDVLQPDVVCTGGITGLRKIATLAREHNLDFTPHTWGDGLGLLANAHLAAAAGSKYLEYPYDPPQWTIQTRDYALAQPVQADGEGWIDLGTAPGLGIELDEKVLERTRVG